MTIEENIDVPSTVQNILIHFQSKVKSAMNCQNSQINAFSEETTREETKNNAKLTQ